MSRQGKPRPSSLTPVEEVAPHAGETKKRRQSFRQQFLHMLGHDDPPEIVAASFAVGVSIAFTPMIGFHLLTALALAFLLKLRKLDVILGTLVVNPLTLPPVSAGAIEIGRLILRARREALSQLPWRDVLQRDFWREAAPAVKAIGIQWAVGMFALSFFAGAIVYAVLVRVLRARRAREAAELGTG